MDANPPVPPFLIMVLAQPETAQQEIIKTKYWELPVASLGDWRPYTAYIDRRAFIGPTMRGREHGLRLNRDLVGAAHGPRGSGKSETISYLLAKKMRMGQPVWTNYPISFYVIEEDGGLTYYESMPLDLDKFYKFSIDIRSGAVGITELQYYVESRTSGRGQNRMASYQIMQIRKTALSFFYDVQNPRWVDNRFGWSVDFIIDCADVAKMNYDESSAGREIEEGEFVHWKLRDMSGILTGQSWEKTGLEYGPFQFDAWKLWDIYPTHWIVDIYEAVNSYKKDSNKQDESDALYKALEIAINDFVNEGQTSVLSSDLWERASQAGGGIKINPVQAGRILSSVGITKNQRASGKHYYNFSELLEAQK